jgi:hypothetical protein
MDTKFTVCLELTYEYARKTYVACVDYCSSDGNISLLSIIGEPQFVMTVEEVRKQSGFPFRCFLVGVRDLGLKK